MTDEQILEILETWADEFSVANLFISFVRTVAFGLAKWIAGLAADLEAAVKKIYTLLPTLIEDTKLGEFIDDATPLLTVLLGLSIMAAGYIVIVKKDGKSNILQNFLILFVVLTMMPLLSGKVATLTMGASDGIFNITEEGSAAAYDVIDDNVVDLYLLMDEDMLTGSKKEHDKIIKSKNKNVISPTKASIDLLKINSTLDYDENNFGSYDKLTKREIDVSTTGKSYLVKMNGGIFDVSHDYYYRYYVNWFPMLTSLIAMFITLCLTSIRLAKMLWEIVMAMFVVPFVAVTDVVTGQRTKELLRNLLSLFAVMGIISVIFGVYNIGMGILSSWQATGQVGNILYLVLVISLSCLTIDGPNVIQRIYGIDAGGRGAISMLSGLYYGSRMAKEAAKAPVKAAAGGVALGKKGYKSLSSLKNKAANAKQKSEPLDRQKKSKDIGSSSSMQAAGGVKDKSAATAGSNKAGTKDEHLNSREPVKNAARSSSTAEKTSNLEQGLKAASSSSSGGLGKASGSAKNGSTQKTFDAHNRTHSGRSQSKGLSIGSSAAANSSKSLRSLSDRRGPVSSPKLNSIKPAAGGVKMPALSALRNKPLAANQKTMTNKDTYQTTDNRIISSLRSKDGFEGGGQQNIVQQKETKPGRNLKNFGQHRTLK